MTSLGFVTLCYFIFGFVCTVTTIVIMQIKKKVFNKSSAYNQTQ